MPTASSLDFKRLDLQALTGREGRTSLDGRIEVTGVMDTLLAPEGSMNLVLGPGVFRGVHLDTLMLHGAGARQHDHGGHGVGDRVGDDPRRGRHRGMGRPHRGSMDLTLEADNLEELDSLAQEFTGFVRDTAAGMAHAQRRAAGEGAGGGQPRFARGDAARERCAASCSSTSAPTP